MDLPQVDDFRSIFLNQLPLLDVRAPVEFEQGAFPFATNLPLINDRERESIGLQYKKLGQDEAIKLGYELVKGEIKEQRVNDWSLFFEQHPQAVLYCFRGGMRSKITQQWLYEKTGTIYPRVKGGYKAMRRFLIDELENASSIIHPVILGGRTGIGKTILLQRFQQQIDLEGIFHHRGSVFGKHVTPQPSQIDIENQLSIELMKHTNNSQLNLLFEDEAANIGSRRIPEVLFNKMKQSPLVLLEANVDDRVNITFNEYITESLAEHQQHYGQDQGFDIWANQLNDAIDRIQRRLGGARYSELKKILCDALLQQQTTNNSDFHKTWIRSLLVDYYDPMYDFQISKKQSRVAFKGYSDEVLDFLDKNYNIRIK